MIRLLLWIFAPLIVLVGCFSLIAILNWEYELKFFHPALIRGTPNYWIGTKLLSVGIAFGLASSFFSFLALRHLVMGGMYKSLKFVAATLVSVVCLLMGLAFVVLGPAAITMLEQMS
jgi:hypothetical protein